MPVEAGDAFILGGYQQKQHLWIVVTPPAGNPEKVVIAMCTTRRSWSDTTVVLRRGDHPFIQHDTVIDYAGCKMPEVRTLELQLERRHIVTSAPVRQDVLQRIQEGLFVSPNTTMKVKEFCDQAL